MLLQVVHLYQCLCHTASAEAPADTPCTHAYPHPTSPLAAWFLSWVRVTNLATGASAYFVSDSWLAKHKGDGFTKRLLTAQVRTE